MPDNILVRIEYEAKGFTGEHSAPVPEKFRATKKWTHWRIPLRDYKYELKFIRFTALFDQLNRIVREKIIKYILTSVINNRFLENGKSEPEDLCLRIDFTASRLVKDGVVAFEDVRINFNSWSHIDTLPKLEKVAYANGEDIEKNLTSDNGFLDG